MTRAQGEPAPASPSLPLRRRAFGGAVVAGVGLLCMLFSALLMRDGRIRPLVLPFFASRVLAAGAVHAILLAISQAMFRRRLRSAALFWAVSVLAWMALGTPRHAAAIVLLALSAAVLVVVGNRMACALLPPESRSIGARLGLGILATSFTGSVLGGLQAFTPAAVAIVAALAAAWGAGGIRALAADLRQRWRRLDDEWTLATALAFEAGFLLLVFGVVAAMAPETRADAVTRYLPYVRSFLHYRGFFDMRWQFPTIMPQAGLTYAAVLFLLGPLVGRCAMILCLAAATSIVAGRGGAAASARWPAALLLASCPLVIWTGVSLYQDAFVAVAVLMVGLVGCDGEAGSRKFWIAAGALFGIAWCAKYSTAGFTVPLLLWGLWRGRAIGWPANLRRAVGLGGPAALVTALPWLVHAWRQSGNPFFPLFSSLFPSPLWRGHIDERFGATFYLGRSLRSILLWPVDMTLHTDRYAEGLPGNLGIVLLVYLLLAVVSIRGAKNDRRVWMIAALVGTVLLWTRTAYLRYWSPALWLLAPSVSEGADRAGTGPRTRAGLLAALLAAIVLQVPMAMIHAWGDPRGWPWDLYRGSLTESDYRARMPGARAMVLLNAADRSWPRFWYTGFQAVGEADGVPLGAQTWEVAYHASGDRESLRRYLAQPGCRYWAVAEDMPTAKEFRSLGIVDDWWRPENLVVSDGTVNVYRSPAFPKDPGPARPPAAETAGP